jgi:FKBP-type peptidyl-prolyl cis-trans isomerase
MARQLLLLVLVACASSCAWARPKPPEYPAEHLDSGLIVHDLVVPLEGPVARTGDEVSIDYLVRLDDGTVVDSSLETGQMLTFRLGAAQVPAGLEQGVEGMRLFGRRELIVPPHLAYGEAGMEPLIPPDAALRFEVELMEIRPAPEP